MIWIMVPFSRAVGPSCGRPGIFTRTRKKASFLDEVPGGRNPRWYEYCNSNVRVKGGGGRRTPRTTTAGGKAIKGWGYLTPLFWLVTNRFCDSVVYLLQTTAEVQKRAVRQGRLPSVYAAVALPGARCVKNLDSQPNRVTCDISILGLTTSVRACPAGRQVQSTGVERESQERGGRHLHPQRGASIKNCDQRTIYFREPDLVKELRHDERSRKQQRWPQH